MIMSSLKLPVAALPNISSANDLREYILDKGCYSREENTRIYDKWFAPSPRYLFRAVNEAYHLTERTLCDVGCGYGMNLLYTRPGSFGIEIEKYENEFTRSLGLTVYNRNIIEDDLSDLPKVEAIWCSAVLEHVDSPHIFLRKLHGLLESKGLIVIFVPTIPIVPTLMSLPWIGYYFSGHLYPDHINAFTPETLRFFCERAGFETLDVSPFYHFPFNVFNHLPFFMRLIDGCVYVGKKIEAWEYMPAATRRVANNLQGFSFIGQYFPANRKNK